ncbi:MAG: hypothetical protein J7501_09955 [Bdellovibrio sp.]|nr:hypothetical protein [Bdellovibrio sp.]
MKSTLMTATLLAMLATPAVTYAVDVQGERVVTADPNQTEVMTNVQVEAKVVKVDKKTREITLKDSSGDETTMVAGDDVRNFDQIKKGDMLRVNYRESLMWELRKGGGSTVGMKQATETVRAEPGQKPGGTITNRVTATGTVTKTDKSKQSVTVKGPNRTVTLKVPNPDAFKNIKVGDQIEAVYTEALAVSVEKVTK